MISQEFGDRPLTPSGISGDFGIVNDGIDSTAERKSAQQYQAEQRELIASRIDAGTATPEEIAWLETSLMSEIATGYN